MFGGEIMPYPRSTTTTRVLALLTSTPLTIRQISDQLGVSINAAQNSAHTLLASGEAVECWVDGKHGKKVRAFTIPKPPHVFTAEYRGDYTGEPKPLRYEQRPDPYISLGRPA